VHARASELVEQNEAPPAQAPEQARAAQAPAAQAPEEELTDAQRAAQRASEQTLAAEAEKGRLQELEAEVQTKQKEIEDLAAKHVRGEALKTNSAKRAAKQRALKADQKASDAEGESDAEGGSDVQDAEAEVWGNDRVKELQSQLDAEVQRLKYEQKKRKLEADLVAKQRGLKEATEAQRAKEQAAAEAVRAAQALKRAELQAAEQARAAEAEQKQLQELEAQAKEWRHVTKELAKKPGCYVRIPSGCPNKPVRTEKWRKDTWAEKSGVDKEGCRQRKGIWDTYCGSEDAEMIFVEAWEGGVN